MKIKFFATFFLLFISVGFLFSQNHDTPIAVIEFDESEFNFGEVQQGEIIQNVFEFTNTSNEPLIISNAKATCGCTVPRWPREPIMPGESASLLVQFDSKNKKRYQTKRITITANTDPPNTYLTLKGLVNEPNPEIKSLPQRTTNVDHESMIVYPNPTIDELNIKMEDHIGKTAFVDIYDLAGQRMYSDKTTITENVNIDVSDFKSGTYTIAFKIEGLNRIAKQFNVNSVN